MGEGTDMHAEGAFIAWLHTSAAIAQSVALFISSCIAQHSERSSAGLADRVLACLRGWSAGHVQLLSSFLESVQIPAPLVVFYRTLILAKDLEGGITLYAVPLHSSPMSKACGDTGCMMDSSC